MRRSNTYKIGDLLGDFVKEYRFEAKLREFEALKYWEELMNPLFARYCKNAGIRNGTLYVEITSPVVKAELQMMRESLREKLNQRLGYPLIQKIIFR